uniref:Uncharacterized protein n=1 Tax=Glossina pallidipes TaxID=7398 RepID=A0A1B0ADB7_GLOPL
MRCCFIYKDLVKITDRPLKVVSSVLMKVTDAIVYLIVWSHVHAYIQYARGSLEELEIILKNICVEYIITLANQPQQQQHYFDSLCMSNNNEHKENMALDGKTVIKEEITEKDAYEAAASTNSSRRNKGSLVERADAAKDE